MVLNAPIQISDNNFEPKVDWQGNPNDFCTSMDEAVIRTALGLLKPNNTYKLHVNIQFISDSSKIILPEDVVALLKSMVWE